MVYINPLIVKPGFHHDPFESKSLNGRSVDTVLHDLCPTGGGGKDCVSFEPRLFLQFVEGSADVGKDLVNAALSRDLGKN